MNTEMTETKAETKAKKPFYKKWWFWLIALLIFFAILGNEDDEKYNGYNDDNSAVVLSEEEYKAGCIPVNYTEIARNPDNYLGVKAVFQGKVIQVQEKGNKVVLRVNVTKGKYDIWEDTIYVDYAKKSSNESRVLEDDIITMYGEINGIKSYTAVLGNEISIPHLIARYIEIN